MKKSAILLALLVLGVGPVHADALCSRLSDRIESVIKEISFESAAGIGDSSTPRETARQLRIVADYSALQLALSQQQAAKCKPFVEAVSGNEYSSAATKCARASQSTSRTYDEIDTACDRKAWRRDQ